MYFQVYSGEAPYVSQICIPGSNQKRNSLGRFVFAHSSRPRCTNPFAFESLEINNEDNRDQTFDETIDKNSGKTSKGIGPRRSRFLEMLLSLSGILLFRNGSDNLGTSLFEKAQRHRRALEKDCVKRTRFEIEN
mmetsp:Transcript_913/g.1863  ORF Transcript_913/g.1863 Transcript_913/m.1863 type:complete len:134 (-) Transcript_913:4-405(-)